MEPAAPPLYEKESVQPLCAGLQLQDAQRRSKTARVPNLAASHSHHELKIPLLCSGWASLPEVEKHAGSQHTKQADGSSHHLSPRHPREVIQPEYGKG